jgi:hypothetical protein
VGDGLQGRNVLQVMRRGGNPPRCIEACKEDMCKLVHYDYFINTLYLSVSPPSCVENTSHTTRKENLPCHCETQGVEKVHPRISP